MINYTRDKIRGGINKVEEEERGLYLEEIERRQDKEE